ncbi:MAG: hypothetical protein WDA00_05755 [Eubacteriales bacterium]
MSLLGKYDFFADEPDPPYDLLHLMRQERLSRPWGICHTDLFDGTLGDEETLHLYARDELPSEETWAYLQQVRRQRQSEHKADH